MGFIILGRRKPNGGRLMNNSNSPMQTRGLLSILVVLLIWGSSFSVTKFVVTEVPPLTAAAIRNTIACLALLPFYLLSRRKSKPPLPFGKLTLMGLSGTTIYYLCFNTGMHYIPASTGAIIEGLVPVAIAIPAALFLKEHLSGRLVAGIILSVIGVILVGFVGTSGESKNGPLGSALIIGAVCLWSVYTLLSRTVKDYDTLQVTAVSMMIGTVLSYPIGMLEVQQLGWPVISWQAWLGLCYCGILASAVAYFLYNKALESLPAAQVGNFLNLNPVIGAIVAFIFLHESFTALQWAGGVLVIAGIWLSSKKSDPQPEK
ncbi:DMT family transporter [Chitinophaga sp.]|uniref:DMT family transporter n=1 Tax=Chitinophaga sp. TaxID=1869181 RepID=UPI002627682B|nr:DMT family transporter [uncultured Chitinophaga sp.]